MAVVEQRSGFLDLGGRGLAWVGGGFLGLEILCGGTRTCVLWARLDRDLRIGTHRVYLYLYFEMDRIRWRSSSFSVATAKAGVVF